mmetsp:Transcript_32416/g.37524  ORF Transcript_32416/g.37524 Transcript_32416/m.37524 type:complete len:254 (-) Transcript_32416:59-820(-)
MKASILIIGSIGFAQSFTLSPSISTQSQTSRALSETELWSSSADGDDNVKKVVPLPKMSQAIPFLERPPALTGELAGDVGFDPLGYAQNQEVLMNMREAEIKHARLAMLAAVGWPLAELWDNRIADYFNLQPALEVGNRVPSFFNGGLGKVSPVWWGFCVGLTAAIDLYGVSRSRKLDPTYIPGDLGFDPLGLYPKQNNLEGRKRMQLAEIKHGRLAMIAITAFAVQEAVSKISIVDETPFFFFPISETLNKL